MLLFLISLFWIHWPWKKYRIFTEKSLAEITNNINKIGYDDSILERCAAVTAGYGGQAKG